MTSDCGDYCVSVTGYYSFVSRFDRRLGEICRIETDSENYRVWSSEEVTIASDFGYPYSIAKYLRGIKCTQMGDGHPKHRNAVLGMAVYGDLVISGGKGDATVVLWNHHSGRRVGQLLNAPRFTNVIHCSATGDTFVAGFKPSYIRQFDLSKLQQTRSFCGHIFGVYGVKTTNSLLLSCSYDKTVRLWDRTTTNMLHKMRLSNYCYSLELSENNIFVGLKNGNVDHFDLRNPQKGIITTFEPHLEYIFDMATIDERSFISVSSDSTIAIWTKEGKLIQKRKTVGMNYGVSAESEDLTFARITRENTSERIRYMMDKLPHLTGSHVLVDFAISKRGWTRFTMPERCFWEE